MQTFTPTNARQHLGEWLKRVVAGENFGVIFGNMVMALRPVEVIATNHDKREYGMSAATVAAAAKRISAAVAQTKPSNLPPEFSLLKVLLTKRFLAAASKLSREDRTVAEPALSGLLAT